MSAHRVKDHEIAQMSVRHALKSRWRTTMMTSQEIDRYGEMDDDQETGYGRESRYETKGRTSEGGREDSTHLP